MSILEALDEYILKNTRGSQQLPDIRLNRVEYLEAKDALSVMQRFPICLPPRDDPGGSPQIVFQGCRLVLDLLAPPIAMTIKTPEELAKEWAKVTRSNQDIDGADLNWELVGEWEEESFLAGYRAAQQWIRMKDREPGDSTWVLGTNGREIETVYKHFTDCYSLSSITHWMPMPPLPPEENKS